MEQKNNNTWTLVIRIVIAVATALLGAIGGSEVYAAMMG